MQSVDECKELLDRGGYKMLDIRPWKAYDREHLTKPPQCTINAPLMDGDDPSVLLAKCENQGLRPAAKRQENGFIWSFRDYNANEDLGAS